jgi:hypothetical protein
MKVLLGCLVLSGSLVMITIPLAHAGPAHRAAPAALTQAAAIWDRQMPLDVAGFRMLVGNEGHIAHNLSSFDSGLEYPRGSGRYVVYTIGPWVAGRVTGAMRTAIAEFATEWVPGPITGGMASLDTLRFRVYRHTVGDTTGHAAWRVRAAPMGAPVDPSGDPLALGDQTLWTVFNDAHVYPSFVTGVPRVPVGVETQLTAWAFDRPGMLRTTAFLRLRLIHKGSVPLDSAAVGLFFDPRAGVEHPRAASDLVRDMGYSYPSEEPAAGEAIAIGVVWLGGPTVAGTRMRPTSIVVYPNGSDPYEAEQYDHVLRGLFPWGAAMVDPTTSTSALYFAPGDPLTGNGWVATQPTHPHMLIAAQPFVFAVGDTQQVDAAVVIGHGATSVEAIVGLRAAADEARAAYDSGFTNLPPPDPNPPPEAAAGRIIIYPNPAPANASMVFRVNGWSERVDARVYDVTGRLVRRLFAGKQPYGNHVMQWDGTDDQGRRVGAGLYFVRVRLGSAEHAARFVILSGK